MDGTDPSAGSETSSRLGTSVVRGIAGDQPRIVTDGGDQAPVEMVMFMAPSPVSFPGYWGGTNTPIVGG